MHRHTCTLPFVCEQTGCGAAFTSRATLVKHGLGHTLDRVRRSHPIHVSSDCGGGKARHVTSPQSKRYKKPRLLVEVRGVQWAGMLLLTHCTWRGQTQNASEVAPQLGCPFQAACCPRSTFSNIVRAMLSGVVVRTCFKHGAKQYTYNPC